LPNQNLSGLFGLASPYEASLFGEQLGRQDAAAPLERQKTLADIVGKQISNQQAQQALELARLTQQYNVDKARLGNIMTEEQILGQRKTNWAKDFENQTKGLLGAEFYAEDERVKQSKAKIEKMEKVYQHLGIAAQDLAKEPPTERHTKLNRYLDLIGLGDEQKAKFFDIPAEQLPQVLKQMSDQVALSAPDYVQKAALQAQAHKNALELQNLKSKLDKQLENLKGKGDLKTFQAAIIQYSELAMRLPPGPEREMAEATVRYYTEQLHAEANARSAEPYQIVVDDKGRRRPEFVGKPMVGVPPVPGVKQAPQGPRSIDDLIIQYGNK